MEKVIKFLNKYWILISICGTLIGTMITTGLHLKSMIDKNVETLNSLNDWVSGHDDSISTLQTKVTRLEALEEARDRVCK